MKLKVTITPWERRFRQLDRNYPKHRFPLIESTSRWIEKQGTYKGRWITEKQYKYFTRGKNGRKKQHSGI